MNVPAKAKALTTTEQSPAAQSADLDALQALAHEINVRLQKADDQRLSASLKLAEAKAVCKKAGVPFKAWVQTEIKQIGYVEATVLAKIGAAPDPAKALEDRRHKTGAAAKRSKRDQKVVCTDNSTETVAPPALAPRPGQGPEAICRRVQEAISTLSGLPPAESVAEWFRGTDLAILVDERLTEAVRWLDDFYSAWGDSNVDQK